MKNEKEIEEALEMFVALPLHPKPFSLKKLWDEPIVTLTKDLVELLNQGGCLYPSFEDEDSRAKLIGTKCCVVKERYSLIGEDELREILTKGSRRDINKLAFYLYDKDNDKIADDIVDYLGNSCEEGDAREYEYISYDVRWHVALNIRLYVENGGDLAKLVKDVPAKYIIAKEGWLELDKKMNSVYQWNRDFSCSED